MSARTIPWETIADWFAENEQHIRDVMKFEGLRGAVNEVLRIAPDQPELSALREELAACKSISCMLESREWAEHVGKGPISEMLEHAVTEMHNELSETQEKLTAAEQRNAELVELLRRLERANDKRTSLTTREAYALASQAPGMRDALIELDDARKAARDVLNPTESGASE